MPKYGIHHTVLTDATGQLLGSPDANAQAAGAVLATNPLIANLGAVGPDLFFWAPDYEVVDKLYVLYENIDELVQLYNQIVQPIRDIVDAIVEPVEDAVETLAPRTVALIRALVAEMRETARLFEATVNTGLFAGVISGANLITDAAGIPSLAAAFFDYFRPPLQTGKNEEEWYWFDMLHYRRTGDFGRQLVANAHRGTAQQQAYAYGYLSHIATDLVGHAYVNQVVGGPYRLQVQRHVTVESFMDTWKFQQYYGENINLVLFNKLGLDMGLDAAGNMRPLDSSVGDLIHQTLQDVYNDVAHPTRLPGDGFLTREQVDQTYEIFFKVLQLMKNQAVARPEEPFSGVAEILQDVLEDLLEPPPSPPSSPSGVCSLEDIFSFGLTASSRDCYNEFFDQLEDWFDYLGDLLSWAFETLLDLLDLLQSLLLSLPISVLLAILYGLQLLLYEIYQMVRATLALEGFVFPEPRDLNDAHGRSLITPLQCGINGCPTFTRLVAFPTGGQIIYPRLTNLSVSHLVCPPASAELPVTTPGFEAVVPTITPDQFINILPLDLEALAMYANSPSPASTRALYNRCRRIGNATDLTAWMIGVASDARAPDSVENLAFTNWNLDSDRGYAYKTWTGSLPARAIEPILDEAFV
jgi:hypothetical protein